MTKAASKPEDFAKIESLSAATFNCYGAFAFVRRKYNENGFQNGKIYLRFCGEERLVTADGHSEDCPCFSPNGKTLAFLSNADECGRQIWLYDMESGRIKRLTNAIYTPRDLKWSPDGSSIAFLASSPLGKTGIYDPLEPVSAEDFGYKYDGAGYDRSRTVTHIWIADATTGDVRQLTDGDFDDLFYSWSPDGSTIVFESGRQRSKSESMALDLYTVLSEGGSPVRISSGDWAVGYPIPVRPFFTKDGRYVVGAFLNGGPENGYPHTHLRRIDLKTGEKIDLFPDGDYEAASFPYNPPLARCGERALLSPDGKSVLFVSGSEGGCGLYSVPLDGSRVVKPLITGEVCIIGLAPGHSGLILAAIGSPTNPGEYVLIDPDNGAIVERLVRAGSLCTERATSKPEVIWFDTLDGEDKVQGWVLPPQNMERGRKYPAVVYVHGGPHPYYTHCMDYEHQCLAGAGFAVLYCNPRGSSGYGMKHQNVERAMDGSAATDILQFVDEAVRRFDFIDPERIGITGGSYGGYMTNYMAAHTKRFKAYVTQRSISNNLISYASSDMHTPAPKDIPFVSFMLDELRTSAVTYAQNIDRPMLILHGVDDYRCPVEGAHQLFVAVKDCHPDLPVKMILFPHCTHEIPDYLPHKLLYHKEMINWFTKYL